MTTSIKLVNPPGIKAVEILRWRRRAAGAGARILLMPLMVLTKTTALFLSSRGLLDALGAVRGIAVRPLLTVRRERRRCSRSCVVDALLPASLVRPHFPDWTTVTSSAANAYTGITGCRTSGFRADSTR